MQDCLKQAPCVATTSTNSKKTRLAVVAFTRVSQQPARAPNPADAAKRSDNMAEYASTLAARLDSKTETAARSRAFMNFLCTFLCLVYALSPNVNLGSRKMLIADRRDGRALHTDGAAVSFTFLFCSPTFRARLRALSKAASLAAGLNAKHRIHGAGGRAVSSTGGRGSVYQSHTVRRVRTIAVERAFPRGSMLSIAVIGQKPFVVCSRPIPLLVMAGGSACCLTKHCVSLTASTRRLSRHHSRGDQRSLDAGPVLRRSLRAFLRGLLGTDESLRQALGDEIVDYILAGMASILLFGYLLYALLRPERF